MDMTLPAAIASMSPAVDRGTLESRLDAFQSRLDGMEIQSAWQAFEALHREITDCMTTTKADLLALGVTWSDEDKSRAAWIHAVHQRYWALGCRLSKRLSQEAGAADSRCLGAIATSLFHAGEAVKSEVALSNPSPRRYGALHGLMRMAMDSGYLRRPIQVEAGGRRVACTLETLYFRALLLARFASGALNGRQVEILDAWLFMWSPALRGSAAAEQGASLRVDLDSQAGLTRDPRIGGGDSLFLPQEPIRLGYCDVLAQLQSGQVVPADGCTAGFRVEDHIAVLGIVRRGFRAQAEQVARAERIAVNATVELFVGLGEVTARGYAVHLAPEGQFDLEQVGIPRAADDRRAREDPLGKIFDVRKRYAQLVNTSDTGACLEGLSAECDGISAGDLVGLRTAAADPLILGKVVRCVASATPGHTIIGIRKLSTSGSPARVFASSAEDAPAVPLIFVSGHDDTGRYDGYLVSEREFEQRASLEARVDGSVFAFRFNRVRERGRGWILAGFQIEGARAREEVAG